MGYSVSSCLFHGTILILRIELNYNHNNDHLTDWLGDYGVWSLCSSTSTLFFKVQIRGCFRKCWHFGIKKLRSKDNNFAKFCTLDIICVINEIRSCLVVTHIGNFKYCIYFERKPVHWMLLYRTLNPETPFSFLKWGSPSRRQWASAQVAGENVVAL